MLIFEPPTSLTGGIPQVWIGASGGLNWGGCQVWLSPDNINYEQIGSITAPCREGLLTAILPTYASTNPDTGHTLSVDLTVSSGILSSGTSADASSGRLLSYVDGELISYQTATLGSSAFNYNLTTLYRGMNSSTIGSHAVGTKFTFLDSTIFKYNLPQLYVGQVLYIKLLSYNQFGNQQQGLGDVTAVTYTPVGVGYTMAAPTAPLLTPTTITQGTGLTVQGLVFTWGASSDPLLGGYSVQWSSNGGTTWNSTSAGPAATQTIIAPVLGTTSYLARVRAVSQNGLAMSAWVTTSATTSGTSTGSGSVTSVALSMPSIFSVTGSPITTSGTLTAALAVQGAHTVLAGPVSGSSAPPTFRQLSSADLSDGTIGPASGLLVLGTAPTTWTPVLTVGGGSNTATITINNAVYSQVDKLIVACFDIQVSSLNSHTGTITLKGLPAVCTSSGSGPVTITFITGAASSLNSMPSAFVPTSTSTIQFIKVVSGASTNLADTDITSALRMIGTAIYYTT